MSNDASARPAPDSPAKLPARSWWASAKRAAKEFSDDSISDWAAALTYYGVLSIFPGLLVIVSILGLLGPDTITAVKNNLQTTLPETIANFTVAAIDQVAGNASLASVGAVIGAVLAFWSASGYIGAFMRASNAIYDVPEGRPIWKTLPIRLGVTAAVGLLLIACALIVVFTGRFAESIGDAIGLGSAAVTAWNIAKWPVLVILVSLMFSILYWASPNARHGKFKWVTPGGLLAVLLWIVLSGLFAVYLANFASYNKTYGAVAGVIVFLVWLWLSNNAILLGAEYDAELQRSRAIVSGHPEDKEPYVELRDDRKLKKKKR
ncbi:YihY/virulence factor BrkB family protein [Asanoa sp. WMMD1127]|uniref:YihY/virulence factor BrkB family protein n=1 Tax=Asanoa sp. WMMD1127 TaxID=3016107 RepID=UPI002416266A|nr:YihY/virulence factor BrkB family protein [Asanoa sp. WMMD1127]MDG4826269.1 YihY/virulence factor BrkB family protein [Asanoa sp. WMMD1127]